MQRGDAGWIGDPGLMQAVTWGLTSPWGPHFLNSQRRGYKRWSFPISRLQTPLYGPLLWAGRVLGAGECRPTETFNLRARLNILGAPPQK